MPSTQTVARTGLGAVAILPWKHRKHGKPPRRWKAGEYLKRWEQTGKITFEPNSGCWLWLGAVNASGHGRCTATSLNERYAHRVAWIETNGSIPDGLHVCHACDVPFCVNPEHLFLGTPADNMQDCVRKGRIARGEQHGMVKLTTTQVEAIRVDRRKYQTIANAYGISLTAVYHVKQRSRWSHVI